MLVAVPQATNSFLFNFVYLDKNKQLLKYYKDSDCMDYIYFRKKFESCTVSRGSAGTGKTYQVLEIAKQVNPCKVIVVSDHPPNIEIHSVIDFIVNYVS